ncbi:MAG: GNAT family N-acetyltransferase [Mogibacterium sp.]|nr:GNAT family N-acetyltransferase [Mogibacterium sp.]
MEYYKTIKLKDGRTCILRNCTAKDSEAVLDVFNLTHAQTDWMLTYPGEMTFTVEQEAKFLQDRTDSSDEVEILAEVGGKVAGTAGIGCVGRKEKLKHRAEFGIGIDRAYWGIGIGHALTEACIECAEAAGYAQLELDVTAENERAIALYKKAGFVEFGRNPLGFRTREGRWQELVLMRRVLSGGNKE